MTDIPLQPKPQDRSAADLERVRGAAEGREHRRAEREQKAYASHYLGKPGEQR